MRIPLKLEPKRPQSHVAGKVSIAGKREMELRRGKEAQAPGLREAIFPSG